jgi:predicted negative regulator of RcsB-dependent stress response
MKTKDTLKKQEEFEDNQDAPETSGTGEEFSSSKIQKFILENKILIIVGSVIVVAAVAIFFYINSTREKSSQEASVALSRIMPYYERMDYQTALDGDTKVQVRGQKVIGFKKIVSEYENTSQGKIAALFAGNCFMELNKPDEAKKYFSIAEDAEDNLVKMGANAGLGVFFEKKNKLSEAAEYYETASSLSSETNAKFRYMLYAGQIYEKSGNKKKAEELFRAIIGEGEYSEFSTPAKAGLVRLGMIIE